MKKIIIHVTVCMIIISIIVYLAVCFISAFINCPLGIKYGFVIDEHNIYVICDNDYSGLREPGVTGDGSLR